MQAAEQWGLLTPRRLVSTGTVLGPRSKGQLSATQSPRDGGSCWGWYLPNPPSEGTSGRLDMKKAQGQGAEATRSYGEKTTKPEKQHLPMRGTRMSYSGCLTWKPHSDMLKLWKG